MAKTLRKKLPEFEIFDDWFAAGPEADDHWKTYEKERGHTYEQALDGYAARHVFDFDCYHLSRSSHCLLVLPAGKSGHLELMYAQYKIGAKCAVLLEPDFDGRYDIMYRFIDKIISSDDEVSAWAQA